MTSSTRAAWRLARKICPTMPSGARTAAPFATPSASPRSITSVRAIPVASRPMTRAVSTSPRSASRKSRRRRRRAFSSSASSRRATCSSSSRTRCRRLSFSWRLRMSSPTLRHVPATACPTAVLPRCRGAITSRKNRPSGSLRARAPPVRSARTPATRRKTAELRAARFRRRKSNTSYATDSAALDKAGAGPGTASHVVGPGLLNGDVLEEREFIQDLAGPHHDRGERVVGQHDGEARLLAQQGVEVAEERAAAGQHDALVDDVRRQLGWRALETDADRLDDLVDGLEERVPDLLVGDLDRLRHAGDQIPALDLHRLKLVAGIRRADRDLDELRGPLPDQEVVLPLDVLDDRLVHLVAPDAHGLGEHDARERDDRHLRGAAPDVDHHVAGRLGDGQPGADRGRHRLFDEVDLARTS